MSNNLWTTLHILTKSCRKSFLLRFAYCNIQKVHRSNIVKLDVFIENNLIKNCVRINKYILNLSLKKSIKLNLYCVLLFLFFELYKTSFTFLLLVRIIHRSRRTELTQIDGFQTRSCHVSDDTGLRSFS